MRARRVRGLKLSLIRLADRRPDDGSCAKPPTPGLVGPRGAERPARRPSGFAHPPVPPHRHPIDTCPHRSPLYMTTSTVEQTSTPQVAVNDIGSAEDFLAAVDQTIKYFNDGDIVSG